MATLGPVDVGVLAFVGAPNTAKQATDLSSRCPVGRGLDNRTETWARGLKCGRSFFGTQVSGFRRACSTRCYRTRCQHRRRSTQIRNRGRTSPRTGLPCIPRSGRRSGDNLFIHKVLDTAEPAVSVVNGSGDTTRAHRQSDPSPSAPNSRLHHRRRRFATPTHWPSSDYPSSHATSILRAPTRKRPTRHAGSRRQRDGRARRCRRRRCRRCLSRQECRCRIRPPMALEAR